MQKRHTLRIPNPVAFLRRVRAGLTPHPDDFLKKVKGLIHIGANTGQERETYQDHALRVVWIEPIPDVFAALKTNVAAYPEQRAFQYLVTDRDGAEHTFNVANNNGESSSILDIKLHKDIWPQIAYEKTILLSSITLPSLVKNENINLRDYDALVLDTQGAELLVLKGADPILGNFRFVKLEVPDFESYEGCCQLRDIEQFLDPRGFREFSRHKFAERQAGGSYYDIVYRKS